MALFYLQRLISLQTMHLDPITKQYSPSFFIPSSGDCCYRCASYVGTYFASLKAAKNMKNMLVSSKNKIHFSLSFFSLFFSNFFLKALYTIETITILSFLYLFPFCLSW